MVRWSLLRTLRRAAESEILSASAGSGSGPLDPDTLYADAHAALAALSALLGPHPWFLAAEHPSLLDAAVFAYTHVCLSPSIPWEDTTFSASVSHFANLVHHNTSHSQFNHTNVWLQLQLNVLLRRDHRKLEA